MSISITVTDQPRIPPLLSMVDFIRSLMDVFLDEAGKVTDYIDRLYNVSRTDYLESTYQNFAGLGPIGKITEAHYRTTNRQCFYREGVKFTYKMRKDEQRGLMHHTVTTLALKMAHKKQSETVAFFNEQLAGGENTPWNTETGKFLFDTDHPLANGESYSNLIPEALSVKTLQNAISVLDKTPDDQGAIMGIHPVRLWVAPAGYADFTNEAREHEVDIDIIPCEYLSDDQGWFLQGDYNKALCEIGCDLQQSQWIDQVDYGTVHEAIFALNVGALDWRGWVGGRAKQ